MRHSALASGPLRPPPTPRLSCQRSNTSAGVRTQIAELITVEPPTSAPCTTGQNARPCAMVEPKSSNMSRSVPYMDDG